MKYKRNIKVIITFLLFLGLVPPKKVWKIIYPIPPKNPTRITYMKRLIDKNEYILIMIIFQKLVKIDGVLFMDLS